MAKSKAQSKKMKKIIKIILLLQYKIIVLIFKRGQRLKTPRKEENTTQ